MLSFSNSFIQRRPNKDDNEVNARPTAQENKHTHTPKKAVWRTFNRLKRSQQSMEIQLMHFNAIHQYGIIIIIIIIALSSPGLPSFDVSYALPLGVALTLGLGVDLGVDLVPPSLPPPPPPPSSSSVSLSLSLRPCRRLLPSASPLPSFSPSST